MHENVAEDTVNRIVLFPGAYRGLNPDEVTLAECQGRGLCDLHDQVAPINRSFSPPGKV